ncbi:protein POLR1D-like isoform X3 [Scyliorhinus canicula]|uniref:protein POLR1D-like isoform X3 n=1 Tax=Scyliorhinus canicula TaxID=7830 RepID=UPI0018F3C027|nr:protein POLR1D-like isoform X3 [Scyliorhinus canicula]
MEKDGELERMKCPLPGANKRFLINTLKNAIPSQRQTYDRRQREEDEDLDLKEKEHRKKNHKNSFQPYKQGSKSRVKANRSPSPRKNDSKRTTKKYKGTNDY